MDPKEIRRRLGLAEDASDEAVLEKIDQQMAAEGIDDSPDEGEGDPTPEPTNEGGDPAPEPEPVPAAASAGTVSVDEQTWKETREAAQRGAQAHARQEQEDRDRLLDAAVKAGKFPPSRRDHYAKLHRADPEGTESLIESLEAGLVPVDERGVSGHEQEAAQASAYPAEWLPEVQARTAGNGTATVTKES